jgi:hypothetical protein
MDENGIYSPTEHEFKFDVCKILGKNLAKQNLFIQALFGMLRKFARLPSTCPVKKVNFNKFIFV